MYTYLPVYVYTTDCQAQSLSWKMIKVLLTNFKIILLSRNMYNTAHVALYHTRYIIVSIIFCYFY